MDRGEYEPMIDDDVPGEPLVDDTLVGAGETSTCANRFIIGFCYFLFIFCFPCRLKVVQEYERAVIFRLGRVQRGCKGPGLIFLLPFVDKMRKVDLRVFTMDIPRQTVVTKDSLHLDIFASYLFLQQVNAIVYFRVSDPMKAVLRVENFRDSTYLLASTTLRSVLGKVELDVLLQDRDQVNDSVRSILLQQTAIWGIDVRSVELRDVLLPPNMQRVMASQAEAEREKRAKVISAQGEFQASERLSEAAKVMMAEKGTMQLRYLRALAEISAEKQSTIYFPLPIDLLSTFEQPDAVRD